MEERGIDGGGLFKEFVDVLLKDMFSSSSFGSNSVEDVGGKCVRACAHCGSVCGVYVYECE